MNVTFATTLAAELILYLVRPHASGKDRTLVD